MVDIDKYIEDALSPLGLPVYGYMPDFGDNEPSEYFVYSYYDTPQLFADNTEHAIEYTVRLDLFTQSPKPSLEKAAKTKMKSKDFIYQGSASRDVTTTYPGKYRKNQEYKITFEEE